MVLNFYSISQKATLQRYKKFANNSNRKSTLQSIMYGENIYQALRHLVQGGSYPSGRYAGDEFIKLAKSAPLLNENFILDVGSEDQPNSLRELERDYLVETTKFLAHRLQRDKNHHLARVDLLPLQSEELVVAYQRNQSKYL